MCVCVHSHACYVSYPSLRKVTLSRDWNDVRGLVMQISGEKHIRLRKQQVKGSVMGTYLVFELR